MKKITLVLLVGMVLTSFNACTASLGFFDGDWEITITNELNQSSKSIIHVEKTNITKIGEDKIINQKVDDDGSFFVDFSYIVNGKEYTQAYKGKLDVSKETKVTMYINNVEVLNNQYKATIRKKK